MKIVLFGAVFFLGVSLANATNVEVLPDRPVNCFVESRNFVNGLYGIQQKEDLNTLTVTFTSAVGSCRDGIFEAVAAIDLSLIHI